MTSDLSLGLKPAEKIRAVIAMWEPISLAAAGPRGVAVYDWDVDGAGAEDVGGEGFGGREGGC